MATKTGNIKEKRVGTAGDEVGESAPSPAVSEPQPHEGPPPGDVTVDAIVEALLFSTDVPLPATKIAQLLEIGDASDVKRSVETLNERYAATGASFRIESIAKGFQLMTLPVYNRWVQKLQKSRSDARLSQAALETLAIVAYKQPALRADIEAIRGVACGDMLVRLREMNLVRIVGRAEEIGRPLLYGTTPKFLDAFGLSSLKDLPKLDPDKPNDWPALRMADSNRRPEQAPDEPQDDAQHRDKNGGAD